MKWSDLGLNIFLSVKVSEIPDDFFPFTPEQKNKTLCLLGHGGKSLWKKLPRPLDINQHPFDQYTINQINFFTKSFLQGDCEILFPNPSYELPLQKIGRLLNLCSQSPIGLDICEEFGLWFAFRGVFLTSQNVITKKISAPPSLCTSCKDRPCLTKTDFNLARLSCPIKREHQYSKEQIDFHQSALDKIFEVKI